MSKSESIKKPLSAWLDNFYDATETVSDLIRKLSFAAIGIIWIFRNTSPGGKILPPELLLALYLVIISMMVDVGQYFWKGITAYILYAFKEYQYDSGKINKKDVEDVTMPRIREFITWSLFAAKIVLVGLSYYHIYCFLLPMV